MQSNHSENSYSTRVQQLGESSKLKRLTAFLELVTDLCQVDGGTYQRYRLGDPERPIEVEERDFIEDCRSRLRAVAACQSYPELHQDLFCRYLMTQAAQAADKRVPLVGECNRIKNLAIMYHDGDIKSLVTALAVTFINTDDSEGATVLVALGQRNTIKVEGGIAELRKRVRTALNALPKLPDAQDRTRAEFLETQARTLIRKTEIPGWRCTQISAYSAEYVLYRNGDLERLDTIYPDNAAAHSGFYEYNFVQAVIGELTEDQKLALGKFLRPKDYDGNLHGLLQVTDIEDVYRVLLYLRRLKK